MMVDYPTVPDDRCISFDRAISIRSDAQANGYQAKLRSAHKPFDFPSNASKHVITNRGSNKRGSKPRLA